MSQWLIERGINSNRLLTNISTDPESTIENSHSLIREHELSDRIAFCAYPMQQYRISSIAHKKGISINFLSMDIPGKLYLPTFFSEQIKVASMMVDQFGKSCSIEK